MTRLLLVLAILVALVMPVWAGDVFVNGYQRQDGTYVQPHWRSAPDSTPLNNWSITPNVNPYTGERGRRQPSFGSGSDSTGESLLYERPTRRTPRW